MLEWCTTYWYVIVAVAGVIAKVLDLLTPHFSEHAGVKKFILVLINICNVLKITPAPKPKETPKEEPK